MYDINITQWIFISGNTNINQYGDYYIIFKFIFSGYLNDLWLIENLKICDQNFYGFYCNQSCSLTCLNGSCSDGLLGSCIQSTTSSSSIITSTSSTSSSSIISSS